MSEPKTQGVFVPSREESEPLEHHELVRRIHDDAVRECAQFLEARADELLKYPRRRGQSERDRRLKSSALRQAADALRTKGVGGSGRRSE